MNGVWFEFEILSHFAHPINNNSSFFNINCSGIKYFTHTLSFYKFAQHFIHGDIYFKPCISQLDCLHLTCAIYKCTTIAAISKEIIISILLRGAINYKIRVAIAILAFYFLYWCSHNTIVLLLLIYLRTFIFC